MISRLSSFLVIITCAGCAAERAPSGGPADRRGPSILAVIPSNESISIDRDVAIDVIFDELVDPVSVPASVEFLPPVSFRTRVRGRRVRIKPDEPLAENQAYVVTLHRGIRDYQNNNLSSTQQLVFSTGNKIPTGRILGKVHGVNAKTGLQLGLFRFADSLFILYQKLDATDEGLFDFRYLAPGEYRLVGVSGGMADFPAGIFRRHYALTAVDRLRVAEDESEVQMQLAPAISEPQIQSVEWITSSFLALSFDGPFGAESHPAALLPTADPAKFQFIIAAVDRDSIVIDLGTAENRLGEPYVIRPFSTPVVAVEDTVPPKIVSTGKIILLAANQPISESAAPVLTGSLRFSEPVRLPPAATVNLFGLDTIAVPLELDSPLNATFIVSEPDRVHAMTLLVEGIVDLAGNAMTDSLIQRELAFIRPEPTGQIRGQVPSAGRPVVVEALDAESGLRAAWTVTDSAGYLIENVPPGHYTVVGYEQVGERPLPFYSGRWEPYRPAAQFGVYPEKIEVRPRWEVDGIDINFYAVILMSTDTTTGSPPE